MNDIEARQSLLNTLVQQGTSVAAQTISAEHTGLKRRLKSLHADYEQVKEAAVDKRKQLQKAVADREVLHELLAKVTTWLHDKEAGFQPLAQLTLSSVEVHKYAEEKKVLIL